MGNLKSVFNVFRRKTSLDAPGCRNSAASFFLFFFFPGGGGGKKIPLKFLITIYVALKVVIKSLDIEHPHH